MTLKLQTTLVLLSLCMVGCSGSKAKEDTTAADTKELVRLQTYQAASTELAKLSAAYDLELSTLPHRGFERPDQKQDVVRSEAILASIMVKIKKVEAVIKANKPDSLK